MALLQTYNASNRVVVNDKTVTYSMSRVTGTWTSDEDVFYNKTTYSWMWEFHRYCQKSYKYVGMDLATANACATAMIQKYTRQMYVSLWNGGISDITGPGRGDFQVGSGGIKCMADITVQQVNGCMYDVIVNVREDDTRLRKTPPENVDIASLFSQENARDYDTN